MPDPFITASDLSALTGRDVTADTGATIVIDAACDICRTVSEQEFNAGTATINLDGTGTDCLLLPQRPVGTVSAVAIMADGGTAETVTGFEATVDGRLLRGSAGSDPRSSWPRGRQNIEVTYTYGYGTADLPRDVRMVALQLASRMIIQGVARTEVVGDARIDYSVPVATDLSTNELRILRSYRQARTF